MKQIIGIACVDAGGYYAAESDAPLPWPHTEGDLDWFKYVTNGGILVVGSVTYKQLQKLPPLKNREIWPVGKDHELKSVDDVLKKYEETGYKKTLYIAGGKRIWKAFDEHCDFFFVTRLNKKWVENGLKFPPILLPSKSAEPWLIREKYNVYEVYVHQF